LFSSVNNSFQYDNSKNTSVLGFEKRKLGEKLYNNSIEIRTKLDNKRKERDDGFKRSMTPNITSKARNIARDPQQFGERLYPYKSDNQFGEFSENLNKNLYGNDSLLKIYSRDKHNDSLTDQFIYDKPVINEKSRKMAGKMESVMTRLTKKKKRNKSLMQLNHSSDLDESIRSKSVTRANPAIGLELYNKGITSMQRRKDTFDENNLIKNESYRDFSYHPSISCNNDEIHMKKK